jgi:HAD superfamily hydrolase (TIGR01490 family)
MTQGGGRSGSTTGASDTPATVGVFDLDGTLTRSDTYLAYLLGVLSMRPARLLRTWRLPFDVLLFRCGLRDNSWLKQRFLRAILGGLTDADLRHWTQRFVDRLMEDGLRQAGLATLRHHQSQAHRTILLSASLDIYVREIAARLEFSDCVCTSAERDMDGRLTGRLAGENCHGPEKLRRMERLFGPARQHVHVVAYGDHRSDLPLLRWADRGVLVSPSPSLARAARQLDLAVVTW